MPESEFQHYLTRGAWDSAQSLEAVTRAFVSADFKGAAHPSAGIGARKYFFLMRSAFPR